MHSFAEEILKGVASVKYHQFSDRLLHNTTKALAKKYKSNKQTCRLVSPKDPWGLWGDPKT